MSKSDPLKQSAEELAEEIVRKWQSVDPFSRELMEHAKYGLERDVAEFAHAYAREVLEEWRERAYKDLADILADYPAELGVVVAALRALPGEMA